MILTGINGLGRCLPGVCAITVLLACAPATRAGEPLYVKNLSPVTGLIGLPSQRSAATRAPGTFGMALHTGVANLYVSEFNSNEGLNLDGEVLRFAFEARYGLAPNWDLQLEVPWMKHSGGHLDSFIDNWHSLWGMPDGGRPAVPRNLLDYRYGGPQTRFVLLDDTSGLGDITASISRTVFEDENTRASLALGYKFATGDENDFLGSGADDAFLLLRFSGEHLSGFPLRWHGQLGYLRAGSSELLRGAQERDLWFAGLTADWLVSDKWSLIAQLDMHAAPMDSGLDALGDDAVLLTLGVRRQFGQDWSVDISVVEDARVQTGPDVIFQTSIRYYQGR